MFYGPTLNLDQKKSSNPNISHYHCYVIGFVFDRFSSIEFKEINEIVTVISRWFSCK